MALPNGATYSSTQDLLDAQTHVWNHIYTFINSMSLKCAVQLGIPDAIHKHGKPMTLSELADAIPINKTKSKGLYRLMRILIHSKFFDKVSIPEGEEAYCLTGASRLLLKDESITMAPFVLSSLNPVMMDPLQHLGEWFQNEQATPFLTKNGKHVWEFTGDDPKWSQLHHDSMASDSRLVASILVKECKHVFEGLTTVVDVGGGNGAAAKAISDAFPGLKFTVLDLPHVVDGLKGSENVSFLSGDMFQFIPHAHAVFLKWNISMWTHEASVILLKNCKEAISGCSKKNGGKVIIVEMNLGDQKEKEEVTEGQLLFDIHLMSRFDGVGERTEEDWKKLFFDAGFTNFKISPVLGLRSVIEVFP